MSYGKKLRYMNTRQRVLLTVLLVCTLVILYEAYMLYGKSCSSGVEHSPEDTGVETQAEGGVRILRSKQDMEQGELLDAGKVEILEVPAHMVPKGAINSLSGIARARLKHKVAEKELLNELDLIPEAAGFEDEDRLMEHVFEAGAVPAAVVPGSIIDIKLFIKGGEDPLVVSKAVVISRDEDLLSFYMNSREQELIKEAAAEGRLYAVQYLDVTQNAGGVTYTAPYEKGGNINAR